jgi:hypothetical protein
VIKYAQSWNLDRKRGGNFMQQIYRTNEVHEKQYIESSFLNLVSCSFFFFGFRAMNKVQKPGNSDFLCTYNLSDLKCKQLKRNITFRRLTFFPSLYKTQGKEIYFIGSVRQRYSSSAIFYVLCVFKNRVPKKKIQKK